jgi:hypothetical protein
MDSDVALDPARTEPKATTPRSRTRLVTGIAYFVVGVIAVVATFGARQHHGGMIAAAAAFAGAVILLLDRIVDSWEHGARLGGLEIGGLFLAFGAVVMAVAPRDEFALASAVVVVAMLVGAAFTFAGPLTKWLSPLIKHLVFVPQNTIARGGQRKP